MFFRSFRMLYLWINSNTWVELIITVEKSSMFTPYIVTPSVIYTHTIFNRAEIDKQNTNNSQHLKDTSFF
jgi:hypothetical protein